LLEANPVVADGDKAILNYNHVFDLFPITGGYGFITEINMHWWSATKSEKGPILPNSRSPSKLETFAVKYYGGNGPTETGVEASIMLHSNNMFVAVQADGSLWPNAATDADASARFIIFDANAGVKDTRTMKF